MQCTVGRKKAAICYFIKPCTLFQAGQDDDPELEEALGFADFSQGPGRLGWMINLNEVHWQHELEQNQLDKPVKATIGWSAQCCYNCWPHMNRIVQQTTANDKESGQVVSAVNCYFMCQVCQSCRKLCALAKFWDMHKHSCFSMAALR